MEAVSTWLQWVSFVVLLIGAVVYLIATWRRTQTEDLRNVADARGDRIVDLTAEKVELVTEKAELQADLDVLRAQIALLHEVHADSVARLVTEALQQQLELLLEQMFGAD